MQFAGAVIQGAHPATCPELFETWEVGYSRIVEGDRPDYHRQRRQLLVVKIFIVAALALALGDHIYRVADRTQPRRAPTSMSTSPHSTTTIPTFTNSENRQYRQQCGGSPSKIDLDFWYGTEYSCAPSWLSGVTTFEQMEDQWYGHACGNYSPTQRQLVVFNNAKFHCPGRITNFLPTFEK